jgi:hypothetical protein
MKCKLRLFSILTLVLAFPLAAIADQEIVVDPLSFDFGNVEIGTTSTNVITVTNDGDQFLMIYSVELDATSDSEFSFTSTASMVTPGTSADINIAFTPGSEGFFTAVLVISSNDVDEGTVLVGLSGAGEGGVTPPTSVADILAFFDASVADGTLVGNGPGSSADNRRNALRNMIEAAGDLIDNGYVNDACEQVLDALNRTDGVDRPPEFVAGPAAPVLADMIIDLMGALGCE